MKTYFLVYLLLSGFISPSAFSFSSDDLKKAIHKYTQNKGVKMGFKKKTYLKLLKKTKKSTGEILISKGHFVLKVRDHLNTQILFDGKALWHISFPAGAKKQVEKVSFSKNQKKYSLSLLFSPDLLFQHFRFISSRPKGRTWILHFKPVQKSAEISSFSVKMDGNLILGVWLKWKNSENEEEYTFSNIRFNQDISLKAFKPGKQSLKSKGL